jgi:phospholipid N-methyltransferase
MKKLLIILSLFFTSCDLLTTRTPESPDTQRTSYLPATTPDILFMNLKNSLKEKVLENYMASFVDISFSPIPFIYIPSSESIASFPTLATWDLSAEQQYFNNLIVNTKDDIPIILDLQNEIKNTMGDSAVYQYDYIISLTPVGENIQNSYRGNLIFNIYLDSRNQWVISRWEDFKLSENPTWSELKGTLY